MCEKYYELLMKIYLISIILAAHFFKTIFIINISTTITARILTCNRG